MALASVPVQARAFQNGRFAMATRIVTMVQMNWFAHDFKGAQIRYLRDAIVQAVPGRKRPCVPVSPTRAISASTRSTYVMANKIVRMEKTNNVVKEYVAREFLMPAKNLFLKRRQTIP